MSKNSKQKVSQILDLSNDQVLLDMAERIRLRGYFFKDLDNSEDKIANLKCMIEEVTDGRPKPFSLMESYGSYVEHNKDPESKLEKEAELTYFAEVIDGGGASISSYEFSIEDMKRFRDWLDNAIAWCQSKKKSKN